MSRIIHGKVTDQNGQPIKNLKIEAWDYDWPDEDDRMGIVYTDTNGNYELHYHGGHWDTAPHNITTWRPDIYITASIRNNNGDWVKLTKSKVYKDHKLREDLRINLKIKIEPTLEKRTDFHVIDYAFKFKNKFITKDLIPIISGEWEMGFCGGMCAGALHRFNHKCKVPKQETTPMEGTPLYNELLERQIDTFSPEVITKIYDWQRSPDLPHAHTPQSIRDRQKAEWPVLKSYIDNGEPVILCLIREEGYLADITNNHQVLAIGYEYHPTPRDLKVEVYDPNDRNGSNFLFLSLSGGRLGAYQKNSTDGKISFRGFCVLNTTKDASKKHYDIPG